MSMMEKTAPQDPAYIVFGMPRVLEEMSMMEKTAPRDTTHIVFGIPMTSGAMSFQIR